MFRPFETIGEVESFYGKQIYLNGQIAYIVGSRITRNEKLIIYIQFENCKEIQVDSEYLFCNARYDNQPVGVEV